MVAAVTPGKRQPWHRLPEKGAELLAMEAFRNMCCAKYLDGEHSPGQWVGISAIIVRPGRHEMFPTKLWEVFFFFFFLCWSLGKQLQAISSVSQLWLWHEASGRAGTGIQLPAEQMFVYVDTAFGGMGILNEWLSFAWLWVWFRES